MPSADESNEVVLLVLPNAARPAWFVMCLGFAEPYLWKTLGALCSSPQPVA